MEHTKYTVLAFQSSRVRLPSLPPFNRRISYPPISSRSFPLALYPVDHAVLDGSEMSTRISNAVGEWARSAFTTCASETCSSSPADARTGELRSKNLRGISSDQSRHDGAVKLIQASLTVWPQFFVSRVKHTAEIRV